MIIHRNLSRRRFLQGSAVAGAALAFPMVLPSRVFGANERLNIGSIGCGGKGEVDTNGVADQNLVALCDVDEKVAANTFAKFPSAKRYKDYRVMLEKEAKNIDAVTVSTPDHHHAPAALRAMRMGKHVYCQKPLTHTVHEARLMRETAAQMKVATQMGNQGHSHPETRRLVELVRHGVLGNVTAVHVWTDRPIWPQGVHRPAQAQPVPPTLAWDLWLGPAPERPYADGYHPFNWRGWWDFGTGALGDMACHIMDTAYWALDLRDPTSVEATSEGCNEESAPHWSIINYQFPERNGRAPVKLTWYDGKKKPPAELTGGKETGEANGVLIIGDKGAMIAPYTEPPRLLNPEQQADFKPPEKSIPRSPGHWHEFVNACKGGPPGGTNWDYAGPLTETVLLGNLAVRSGKKIEWDAKNMTCTNVPEANKYVKREYRKGWELPTL